MRALSFFFFLCSIAGLLLSIKAIAETRSVPPFEIREYNVQGYLLVSPQVDSTGKHPMMILPSGTVMSIPVPTDTVAYTKRNGI